MRDFAAFVSLSSRTSPRGLPVVWVNVPGVAPAFRCGSGWPARKGSLELGAISLGLVAQLVRARA